VFDETYKPEYHGAFVQSGSSANAPCSAVFARNGEYWTVGWQNVTFSVRDTKGLSYIQRLLQHLGEEFHALDLLVRSNAGMTSESG
jgi:hypothetical protein